MKHQLSDTLTHTSFDTYKIDIKLQNLIETYIQNNTFHFLFYGPAYSGKTSIIDVILSSYYKDVNKDKYILHISSLFDNGIQYFKTTLKTFCKTNITHHKKKTIILDDLDLITENNQHVLRNYIDHYRDRVNFIGSCTNIRKVIETLQSRLVNISLPVLNREEILDIIQNINSKYNLKFKLSQLKKIASKNNYNLNATVNVMQKISLSDKLNDHSINENATTINFDILHKYFNLLLKNRDEEAIRLLLSVYDHGFSTHDIYDVFYRYVTSVSDTIFNDSYKFLKIICKYIQNNVKIIDSKLELFFFSNDLYNEASTI